MVHHKLQHIFFDGSRVSDALRDVFNFNDDFIDARRVYVVKLTICVGKEFCACSSGNTECLELR